MAVWVSPGIQSSSPTIRHEDSLLCW